mgnify:FL=1
MNSLLILVCTKANCVGRKARNILRKCIDENFLVVFELFVKKLFKRKPRFSVLRSSNFIV